MNKTILLGRLTKDPEIKMTKTSNVLVTTFTLAVDRKYVKQGEERQADFINIVAYSKVGEFVKKYLSKGSQICLAGRIQTRNYEDEKGQKHYITEIIAEEISFAGNSKKLEDNSNIAQANTISENKNPLELELPDDLPF